MTQIRAVVAAGLLAAASAAGAQPPAVERSGEIQYVTGGVGEDERLAFDEARKAFNLELIFADQRSGSYLSDVEVTVLDKGGREVLKTLSQGPRLLARMPPGSYKVMATFDGTPQARNVSVPAKGTRTVPIYWHDPTVVVAPDDPGHASRGTSAR